MSSSPPRWSTALQTTPNARFAVAGDAVVIPGYAGARSDHLFAFALEGGTERWRVALDDFVLASAVGGVELAGDPAGDAVYLAQGTMVACFDAATGAKRWAVQVPAAPPFESFTFAHPPVVAGEQLLLLSRRSRVVALDRRDGALRFTTPDQDAALDLVVCDDVVITRSREVLDVRAHELASGDAAWTYPLSRPSPGSSRLGTSIRLAGERATGGRYIIHDGEVSIVAIDVATGAGCWERPLAGPASHAFAGDVLVVADPLAVRGIDPQSSAVLWRHQTHGPSLVAPLDDARALVHFPASVCTVDATTGAVTEHARHQLHDADDTLDARAGSAVVTTDGGTAHWFRLAAGALAELRLGEVAARPGAPAAHGIQQAAITPAGVITFNTAGELQRFDA